MPKQKFTGVTGLTLPGRAIRVLKDRGIFAHAHLSIAYQQLAGRYVIRGLESGGSVGDVGRYVTFAAAAGEQLDYLNPVESIAVNGIHGIVVSPELLRVDLLRKGRTYELLITGHALRSADKASRPQLETEILFRGIHGRLELDLSGKDKAQAGTATPSFFSFAGEPLMIPEMFLAPVRAATKGANCVGCSHAHYLRKPRLHGFAHVAPNRASAEVDMKVEVPAS